MATRYCGSVVAQADSLRDLGAGTLRQSSLSPYQIVHDLDQSVQPIIGVPHPRIVRRSGLALGFGELALGFGEPVHVIGHDNLRFQQGAKTHLQ